MGHGKRAMVDKKVWYDSMETMRNKKNQLELTKDAILMVFKQEKNPLPRASWLPSYLSVRNKVKPSNRS